VTSSSQAQDLNGQDPLATWVTVFGFPPAAASFVLSQVTELLRHTCVGILLDLGLFAWAWIPGSGLDIYN
jgi:hypothetical protein